jgi:hypothetical protein
VGRLLDLICQGNQTLQILYHGLIFQRRIIREARSVARKWTKVNLEDQKVSSTALGKKVSDRELNTRILDLNDRLADPTSAAEPPPPPSCLNYCSTHLLGSPSPTITAALPQAYESKRIALQGGLRSEAIYAFAGDQLCAWRH